MTLPAERSDAHFDVDASPSAGRAVLAELIRPDASPDERRMALIRYFAPVLVQIEARCRAEGLDDLVGPLEAAVDIVDGYLTGTKPVSPDA